MFKNSNLFKVTYKVSTNLYRLLQINMLQPTKIPPKKPRKRTPKPRVKTDIHKLYDGDVTLYRTPNSGDVYQFQMWIHKEQKYIRKSTRSRNGVSTLFRT